MEANIQRNSFRINNIRTIKPLNVPPREPIIQSSETVQDSELKSKNPVDPIMHPVLHTNTNILLLLD